MVVKITYLNTGVFMFLSSNQFEIDHMKIIYKDLNEKYNRCWIVRLINQMEDNLIFIYFIQRNSVLCINHGYRFMPFLPISETWLCSYLRCSWSLHDAKRLYLQGNRWWRHRAPAPKLSSAVDSIFSFTFLTRIILMFALSYNKYDVHIRLDQNSMCCFCNVLDLENI